MLGMRRNLGLAVTEQGMTAVEVGFAQGRRTILRTAVVPFSDGADLRNPAGLGEKLRQVLRENGFSCRRCVMGLSASWLAAREKFVPATDADAVRGALSLAVEREFASGAQELAFDYSGTPSEKGISALLVAAPRRIVEQLAATAKAAGLTVSAMTSSVAALALSTRGSAAPAGRVVLCLLPRGAEMAAQSSQGVRLIRHLPVSPDPPGAWADDLSNELRRIPSLTPAGQQPGEAGELLVWDASGLEPASLESVGRRLGMPLRLCRLAPDLEVADASGTPTSDKFAQAAALACSAGRSQVIDFLSSRLAPPPTRRLGRPALLGIAASAVLLAGGLFFLLGWRADQRDVADLRQKLASQSDTLQQAKDLVDQASFAQGWYGRRPMFLDCLRQIALGFPEDGRIWATSMMVREDMQVLLSGKAVSQAAALEVLDRLKANPRLANVKSLFIRQVGGTSREWSFAISLNLRGGD